MIKKCLTNLVFMGPPGVGKGTVASELASQTDIVHLSTGNIFREEIASKSELGLQIKSIVESGQYVPDSITNEVVRRKLAQLKKEKRFVILDGYPRTIEQVHFLNSLDFKYNVVELYAPEDLILKRLSGRRQCPQCKASYNIYFLPSAKGDLCEKCSTPLITRKDDSIEAIKVRQDIYQKETKPILDYYEEAGLLTKVDASSKVEESTQMVLNKVCNF